VELRRAAGFGPHGEKLNEALEMASDGLAVETAEHLTALATGGDHLGGAEDPQVPAHPRLAHLTAGSQLADAELTTPGQEPDDSQARGVGQPFEVHGEVEGTGGDGTR